MKYTVSNRFPFSNNTAVIIDGNGEGLKNDIMVNDGRYHLISIGMSGNIGKTVLLIEGEFTEDTVITKD